MSNWFSFFTKLVLLPCSMIYGLIAGFRNWLYDMKVLKSESCDIPVIVVGNITVGGTGKTPHVEYLVSILRTTHKVAVLSRGYKRKTREYVKAGRETPWTEIGDEPYQIKQKFADVEVVVDAKRKRGIKKITEEKETQVIIMDDGFQHRAVKPGLSILLIDYNRPLSGDYYLPAGRLRESRYEVRRANIILFTKCPPNLKPIEERIRVKTLNPFPYQQVFFTTFQYGIPVPVFPDGVVPDESGSFLKKHSTVLVVTGIANPTPLIEYVKGFIPRTSMIRYPDHHKFTPKDIKNICRKFKDLSDENKFIVTTEKDAVRLRSLESNDILYPEKWFYIPVRVRFLQESEQKEFNKLILDYVKNDKGNYWLFTGKSSH